MRAKILMIGIVNRNFGDAVIRDNTNYIFHHAVKESFFRKYDVIQYDILSRDYTQIPYVDAIIFVGGGMIKYSNEKFHELIPEILELAEEHQIPVFFNSVGVEGYDDQDPGCQRMKKVLNYSCVKSISVRDDYDTFVANYLENPRIRSSAQYDPAIFSGETYAKDLTGTEKNEKCIGLGVGRIGLFEEYGRGEIDREFQLDFWKTVAENLESKGYDWKIFTNGAIMDEEFAEEVLAYIGHGEKLKLPLSSTEVVQNIHSFSGIIACRMHSNIIAYTLGIPSVGLVWNQKMTHWGEKIGYPQRFVQPDDIKADYVVDTMLQALKEGCHPVDPTWKENLLAEMNWFVSNYGKKRNHKIEKINYERHLLAVALGCKEMRYRNMNTLEMLDVSWQDGYRNMELDLRITSDEELVCVNGWGKGTYKRLGVEDVEEFQAIPLERFLKCSYYGKFPTASFRMFLEEYSARPYFNKIQLVLDIGKPKDADCQIILQKIKEISGAFGLNGKKVILRLQTKKHVKMCKDLKMKCNIAFYLDDKREKYKEVIAYCKKNKIEWISLNVENYTEDTARLLRDQKMKAILFSYRKGGDMIQAIRMGAELVGSNGYSISYLKGLTNR